MKKWQQNVIFFSALVLTIGLSLGVGYLFRAIELTFLVYPVFLVGALYLFDRYFPERRYSKWAALFFAIIFLIPSIGFTLYADMKPVCDAKYGPDYDCYPRARDQGWTTLFGLFFIACSFFITLIPAVYYFFVNKKSQWSPLRRSSFMLMIAYFIPIVSALLYYLYVRLRY